MLKLHSHLMHFIADALQDNISSFFLLFLLRTLVIGGKCVCVEAALIVCLDLLLLLYWL